MNIFRAVNTVSYRLFIFLLFSGRNLVESRGSSSTRKSGTGGTATPKSGTQQQSTPAARTGSHQPSGQSASSQPAGGASLTSGSAQAARTGTQGGAGSPVTTPPANEGTGTSPTSGGGNPANQPNDLQTKSPQNSSEESKFEEYHNHIKLFKADPNDNTKTIELTTSEYEHKFDVDEHIYTFKDNTNCSLIQIEGKDLWKYGSTTPDTSKSNPSETDTSKFNAMYPKGMSIEEQIIFIYFDGLTEVYSKKSGEWNKYGKVNKDISKENLAKSSDPKKTGN
ncbi:conserved hypothetical protein [Theileria orientalis strain Shintoku]|uniref:SfiI-subtelomeric related protein family member n=1 Tax=Theileria orientalis strain Shintoku TaxID=869250 RepID=J7MCD4_THEOR|nr:conserved hypothetical protein [Theileria orientalis strain Shintoku]BAM42442.1 conserved hypothetical protein [Theileria orientalis strain Shintoku]|eukprot:XP_009692743.1 conserved hypothetical protein [Theileria orientalis strain Shintoku]